MAGRLVAEMIGHGVAGNPIQPASEGTPSVLVTADISQRLGENLGRYVFGRWDVMEACVDESVDTLGVAIVKNAKGIGVNLRPLDEEALILVHARSLWRNSGSVITEFTDCEVAHDRE
jgi:hypothetical protein